MTATPLDLTREQILAHRRAVNGLEQRLPYAASSLASAARAGLQDSMPRAAVLSIHARVAGAGHGAWDDPALVQLWGPRFSAYAVAATDLPVFSLGRLPDDARGRQTAEDLAEQLDAFLEGRRMTYGEAGRALGMPPNRLRYAATTGRVLIRWDGARVPTIWTVPRPNVDPAAARLELARRYLEVFGPATTAGFARWAGIGRPDARAAFDALEPVLTPARTLGGEGWILTRDEEGFRVSGGPSTGARLLPSGDAFYLLWGADRELLVPDAARREQLWTSRVWPGAVLVDGEIRGTWRRAQGTVTIDLWEPLSDAARAAVELEAARLPLPGLDAITVEWSA